MELGWYGRFLFVILQSIYLHCESRSTVQWALAKSRKGTYDGDILIHPKTLQQLKNSKHPNLQTRNLIKSNLYRWDNGIVPYTFSSIFDSFPHEKTMILSAIGEIHKVSCVRFVARTTEQYYVEFVRGSGCSSFVGRLQMAAQSVSIGNGCQNMVTILHELLHVLGFFHTSSRTDRDSYVIVKSANLMSGYEHNFLKLTADQVDDFGAPYELDSIMHPPRNAWSKNGQNTVESKRGPNIMLGSQTGMTEAEIGQLNTMYKCSANLYPVCYRSLGLQDGRISDSRLTAKSYRSYHDPHQARLHLASSSKGNGAWCPSTSVTGQWLQIDFGSYKYIKGIATQGFISIFGSDCWVKHYNFHFSYDGLYWYDYATWFPSGLSGNWDGSSVQYNRLPVLISTRYLRIFPTQWHVDMCLRLEIYGCDYTW